MTRYCILGGGGSFGLHLSRYLLALPDTERVLAVGRSPPKQHCFTLGIGDNDKRYCYRALHIDHEHDLLLGLLSREEPHVIVNFAAQGEGATSFDHSWRYYQTNAVALVRLADELRRPRHHPYLRRFIHIGTSELYGATSERATEDSPVRPTSPYAASKSAFDFHLMAIYRKFDFPMNIVRPCNAYGEGQQLHRLIPRAVLFGLTGQKLPLHGGGLAEKSYIHSQDLARAIHLVAESGTAGEIYNCGASEPISIRRVVDLVAMHLEIPFEEICHVTPDRAHQDARYWLDSSKLRAATGWEPRIGLNEGIAGMVAWGREHAGELRKLPTEFMMRA